MHYSSEEKQMWLDDWRLSGKSAWAYAKDNGLIPQTFVRWTKAQNTNKPSFVEIPTRLISPPPRQSSQITIEKGDVKIHISLSENCAELRAVMEVLGGVL